MSKSCKTLSVFSVFFTISALVLFSGLLLGGCENPLITYRVTFDSQNGDPEGQQFIQRDSVVVEPKSPIRDRYTFTGWYTTKNAAPGSRYDFSRPVISDLMLYAGWKRDGLVWIPDNNFREFLKTALPKDAFEGDSLAPTSQSVLQFKEMNMYSKSVKSLKGIEYFLKLSTLSCDANSIDSLDLRHNLDLTTLHCSSNTITYLNVAQNAKLEEIVCSGNGRLTKLDVSGCPELITLTCDFCAIDELDLSFCPKITKLVCNKNNLAELDLLKNTSLTEVNCNYNLLTELDLSRNIRLTKLDCGTNKLTSLDIRGVINERAVLTIDAGNAVGPVSGESSNLIDTLRVLNRLRNHEELQKAKNALNALQDTLTIVVYNNDDPTSIICDDYDPTVKDANTDQVVGECLSSP